MIQKIGVTDARIEEFKSWDGAAWFRAHMAWLKGSYHVAQLPVAKDVEDVAVKREMVKKRPHINEDKQDSMWKYLVKSFGVRQAKRLVRK